jgi:hypothetical protein
MNDPLGLNTNRDPESIRRERAAPLPVISNIYNRITHPYSADAMDVRLVLLAHLLYMTYTDLKENQTQ